MLLSRFIASATFDVDAPLIGIRPFLSGTRREVFVCIANAFEMFCGKFVFRRQGRWVAFFPEGEDKFYFLGGAQGGIRFAFGFCGDIADVFVIAF